MRFLAVILGGLGLLAFPYPAFAQDCTAPCAGYEISTELQNDWIFAADPSFLTSDVLQPAVTTDLYAQPAGFLLLFASIITEPVVDPAPGDNAAFEGIGTYVAELYAQFEAGPVTLGAGKFDTAFSLASEMAPGINATELASNADADERLGAELILGFEGFGLNYALAATAFTTDRTVLSESLFTHRPRTRLSDGGTGNSEGISSFSLTLDGCKEAETVDCYEDGDFGYRIGFRHQEAGHATPDQIEEELTPQDEEALLAAATRNIELDDKTLKLLAEAVYLRNFEGGLDDALILTGSAALDVGRMRYVATYSRQNNVIANEPDTHEYLADLEALYSSEDDTPFSGANWGLGAAYTYVRNDERETGHLFSLRAVFDFGGSVELGE